MANHAVQTQLPIMVRKPKVVWPGLDKMGLYQKQIAGDGNCLFASLSDQLYGTPTKHSEIRARIIEHMRTFRPLFEHYVHKDDLQQRRALRSATNSARKEWEDAFEEYLWLMSRTGTYGGEPELVAFCQVYDQDVTVHLPRIQDFDRDSILYKNEHRTISTVAPSLHICYGGDEITRAHYDSARIIDGALPRSLNSPVLQPQESRRGSLPAIFPASNLIPSMRAVRNSRSDLSSEMIHDLIQKGKRDVEGTLVILNDKARVRSPSVSSSHRSSSSKRSLDDDIDHHSRASKRADRRKSTRKRADMSLLAPEPDSDISFRLNIESPNADTPTSTQDTESSSETQEPDLDDQGSQDYRPEIDTDQASDSETSRQGSNRKVQGSARSGTNPTARKASGSNAIGMVSIAERTRSTLRT